MPRCSFFLGALAACLACVGVTVSAQESNPVQHPPQADGAEARLLVKFREGAAGRAQGQAANTVQSVAGVDKVQALAARTQIKFRGSRAVGGAWHAVELDPTMSLPEQLVRIRSDESVEAATIDRRRYPHAVPDDPLYAGQWYLQASALMPAAIDAEHAWSSSTGSDGVVIAVLDTGVRYDHPDLGRAESGGGRLLPGYDFVSDTRMANDGDGRDADPTDPGDYLTWAERGSPFFQGCGVSGSSWHGTRVAGIIGARTNNANGVAGVTWSPWILPVRVLGKCGGFDSDIMAAMLWAAGIHVDDVPDNPYPAQIENLSLGASGVCTQPYLDTIAAVTARGTLVVVSAGNEGGPVDEPANCPGVAGIAGLRHVGTKVGYSSLGPEIAVAAPAGNCVNSTGACLFPINTTSNDGATIPGSSTYTDQLNANVGTSFAAPIVSGIVGLMLATNGNLSPAQLRSRLREGATAPFPVSSDPAVPLCHVPAGPMDFQGAAGTGECSCTTDTCGAGMANALGSVNAAARPIAAVSMPVNVSAGQRVALSAAGSSAACGRTLTSYEWTGPGLVTPPNEAAASFNVPTSGQVTATVTVTDDAGRTDSADVIIFPTSATTAAPAEAGSQACRASIPAPVPVTVTVDPATASINAGASQTFTATVAHSANTVVNWSVNGIVGGAVTTGTITTAGVFTAPALLSTALTVTVTATWSGDSSKSASSTVTLNPAPVQAQQSSGGGGGGGGAFGGLELFGLAAAALLRRGRVRRAATGA